MLKQLPILIQSINSGYIKQGLSTTYLLVVGAMHIEISVSGIPQQYRYILVFVEVGLRLQTTTNLDTNNRNQDT